VRDSIAAWAREVVVSSRTTANSEENERWNRAMMFSAENGSDPRNGKNQLQEYGPRLYVQKHEDLKRGLSIETCESFQ
jgi:hypothetical protein